MKIIFTGGHHNSSLIISLMLKNKGHQIYWFGHKHTMKNDQSLSAEYLEVTKNNIPFFELKSPKFYKNANLGNLFDLIGSIIDCFFKLKKIKPNLIVSFGGYLAVPVVLAGWLQGIPSITHEQTTKAGYGNKIISFFAKRIFVAWESSLKYFSRSKSEWLGLPIPKNLLIKQQPIFNNGLRTLLVLGGKQGSHLINKLIEAQLTKLLSHYNVIHQCGRVQKTGDYNRLVVYKNKLNKELRKRYLLKPYFFEQEIIRCFQQADLVVSRAGAHTVYTLALLKKPAILLPISWVSGNEQFHNAMILKQMGTAIVLDENNVNSSQLYTIISNFFSRGSLNVQKTTFKINIQIKKDASKKMVDYIEKNF